MKMDTVLAIDASTEGCSVALQHQGKSLAVENSQARTHAQTLLPMIDDVFNQAGISLKALDYIALVHGPGSFTGIRIALSVAQGLAYGAKLPVVCVSSLDVLAHSAAERMSESRVVVCALDARMGEVYWSSYSIDEKSMAVTEKTSPQVSSYQVFNNAVANLQAEFGDVGAAGSAFLLDEVDTSLFTSVLSDLQPKAKTVLSVLSCMRDIEKTKQDVMQVEPLYLRNEVAWQKRQRIRTESVL